jgi:hypothetical protein
MWSAIISRLTTTSPSQWCQAYFLLVSGATLAIAVLPKDIKQLFIAYGSRTSSASQRIESRVVQPSSILKFASCIASSGRVPHSWFTSFYITSTACSIFWAVQYLLDGRVFRFVTSRQATAQHSSTPLGRTKFVWAIFALHGTRRLLEHLWVMRASASDMWLPHWLFGISFYLVMSVAIWIEGSGKSSRHRPSVANSMLTSQADCKEQRAHRRAAPPPCSGLASGLLCLPWPRFTSCGAIGTSRDSGNTPCQMRLYSHTCSARITLVNASSTSPWLCWLHLSTSSITARFFVDWYSSQPTSA